MSIEHARDPGASPERLAAFRRGDRVVLEDVFRAYAPYVNALVRRGLRTSRGAVVHITTDVDDIVQEVFVRIFQATARARFDAGQTFAAYLSGFARLVVLETLRQRNKTPLLAEGDWVSKREQQWDPAQALPDTLVDKQRAQAHVRAFVAQLSDEAQTFVRLRFEHGLPQRDVAERMNATRHRVRVLEEDVRSELRAFWAEVHAVGATNDV